jgi:hypothetical protein
MIVYNFSGLATKGTKMLSLDLESKKHNKKLVNLNLSTPLELIGRSAQFQRIVEVLAEDGDLLIAGVPGSGRRNMVRGAALEVGAVILELDCIRCTDGERFVQLLAETISQNFDIELIQDYVNKNASEFFSFVAEDNLPIETEKNSHTNPHKLVRIEQLNDSGLKLKIKRQMNPKQIWQAFQILIELPQQLAELLNKRVVVILESFYHIRSWDKNGLWEATVRREIHRQTHVNYVLIANIAEAISRTDEGSYPFETLQIFPIASDILALWARTILHAEGLTFESKSKALQLFLEAVQGHIGDAMALIRRLTAARRPDGIITEKEVQSAIEGLLKDLSMTFESLLMLLPGNQVHLLECLAIDPTEKPQSKEYIQKHGLSRGGSLQGALMGLQHKGLIFGAEQRYQVALPLLALWLRQKLG